jgi:hypothetical protein
VAEVKRYLGFRGCSHSVDSLMRLMATTTRPFSVLVVSLYKIFNLCIEECPYNDDDFDGSTSHDIYRS